MMCQFVVFDLIMDLTDEGVALFLFAVLSEEDQ